MINRSNSETAGQSLPQTWIDQVKGLLNTTYEDQIKRDQKTFDVYGEVFENEIVVAASWLDPINLNHIPTTFVASCDAQGGNEKKKLNALIDSIGIFFDNFFSTPDWSDYQTNWTEAEIKGTKIYYCATRENLSLSKMADDLLKE